MLMLSVVNYLHTLVNGDAVNALFAHVDNIVDDVVRTKDAQGLGEQELLGRDALRAGCYVFQTCWRCSSPSIPEQPSPVFPPTLLGKNRVAPILGDARAMPPNNSMSRHCRTLPFLRGPCLLFHY